MYRHTQFGTVTVCSLAIAAAAAIAVGLSIGWPPVMNVAIVLLLVALVLFHSLTIEVDRRQLRCRFGWGPIGRTFALDDIVDARAVRNPWYFGWGIRWTPYGWLFNVSGVEAVELKLRNGSRFRIGTDQPQKVVTAIERYRAMQSPSGDDDVKR